IAIATWDAALAPAASASTMTTPASGNRAERRLAPLRKAAERRRASTSAARVAIHSGAAIQTAVSGSVTATPATIHVTAAAGRRRIAWRGGTSHPDQIAQRLEHLVADAGHGEQILDAREPAVLLPPR